MRDFLSVIIPVYNHARELRACLASLQRQTYQEFELIIIDDGSTDDVAAVAEQARRDFSSCTFLQQQNRGAPAARNRGADVARGDYLLFLDADIILEPNALMQWLQTLEEHPEADFAYSPFYFGWKLMRGIPFDPVRLKQVNYIPTTSLVRAAVFPGFDESLKRFQDWDLWLTLVERGSVGRLIQKALFKVKPRRNGMSAWLPSFVYLLPWRLIPWKPRSIESYFYARKIIKQKHCL